MTNDKIIIKGLRVMGCHGVLPQEKTEPQPYVIDLTLYTDLRCAGKSDDIADTVSYAEVVTRVADLVRETDDQLLERLATRIADAVLWEFPVWQVTVRLQKPQAPIDETFDCVGVEITRNKERTL